MPPEEVRYQVDEEKEYDGLTVEIPKGPVWLLKRDGEEEMHGPFNFFQVREFLKDGTFSPNDKISRQGTNRFNRLANQYEFNVEYSVENEYSEKGETIRIYIRRRHPRADYIADIRLTANSGTAYVGRCVNISAGGILAEVPELENVEINDAFALKIFPAAISRELMATVKVTNVIAKSPRAVSLQFDNISEETKLEIENFVRKALRKEATIVNRRV